MVSKRNRRGFAGTWLPCAGGYAPHPTATPSEPTPPCPGDASRTGHGRPRSPGSVLRCLGASAATVICVEMAGCPPWWRSSRSPASSGARSGWTCPPAQVLAGPGAPGCWSRGGHSGRRHGSRGSAWHRTSRCGSPRPDGCVARVASRPQMYAARHTRLTKARGAPGREHAWTFAYGRPCARGSVTRACPLARSRVANLGRSCLQAFIDSSNGTHRSGATRTHGLR